MPLRRYDQTPFNVDARPAVPLPRTQSSLENYIQMYVQSLPATEHDISEAESLYRQILWDCKTSNVLFLAKGGIRHDPYVPPTVPGLRWYEVQTSTTAIPNIEDPEDENENENENENEGHNANVSQTRDFYLHHLFAAVVKYSPTNAGKVNVIRMVLLALFPSTPDNTPAERSLKEILLRAREKYTPANRVDIFMQLGVVANEIIRCFFVPLRAEGGATPGPTFITSSTSSAGSSDGIQGTFDRLKHLRKTCLARDNYRCVVTGILDSSKGTRQLSAMATEVAHIIPHFLNKLDKAGQLPASTHTIWNVINIFDPGLSYDLEGERIDMPRNALVMVPEIHARFGRLEVYFNDVPGTLNTYTFHTTRFGIALPDFFRPQAKQITFANHEPDGENQAALPSKRLLRFHRACCKILEMSGAAEYVESLLHEAEELAQRGTLKADGSSDLGLFMRIRGLYDEGERRAVMVS